VLVLFALFFRPPARVRASQLAVQS
jgi:hypothetical protein